MNVTVKLKLMLKSWPRCRASFSIKFIKIRHKNMEWTDRDRPRPLLPPPRSPVVPPSDRAPPRAHGVSS